MTGIKKRIFIVGASRSGTSLLQRIIASHNKVYTLPETGVFLKAMGMRYTMPWVWFGYSSGLEMLSLRRVVKRSNFQYDLPMLRPRSLPNATELILRTLDELALSNGAEMWLEKTPRHFIHAAMISELVPDSHVIHIVRDGRAVVASICDRARKYPQKFRRQSVPSYAIQMWNKAVKSHLRCRHLPGHTVIDFDKMVDDPAGEVSRLCQRIGLDYHDQMLDSRNPTDFIRQRESWKDNVKKPITKPKDKFSDMFDVATRKRIEAKLNWTGYKLLVE